MKRPIFIGGVVVLSAAVAASLLFVFSDFTGFRGSAIRDDRVVVPPRSDGRAGVPALERVQGLADVPAPTSNAPSPMAEDAVSPSAVVPADELATNTAGGGVAVPSSPEGEVAVAPVGQPGGHVVAGAAAGPDTAAGVVAGGKKPSDRALADVIERPLADVGTMALQPDFADVDPPDLAGRESELAVAPADRAVFVAPEDEDAAAGFGAADAALVDQPSTDVAVATTELDAEAAEKSSPGVELVDQPAATPGDAGSALAARGEPDVDPPVGEVVAGATLLTGPEAVPILERGSGAATVESGSSGSAPVGGPLPGAVAVETQLDDLAVAGKLSLGIELAEKPAASSDTVDALTAREEPQGTLPTGEVVSDAAALRGSGTAPALETGDPTVGQAATPEIVTAMVAEGSEEQPLRIGAVSNPATIGAGVVGRPAASSGSAQAVNDGADVVSSAVASQLAAAPATAVIEAPKFDVVRVDRLGNTVIAGRSSPSCQVTVHDEDEVIGVVTADRRGEWVLLPIEPLRPGDRQLSLSANCGSAGNVDSERLVIVVVPETGLDIAGRPTSEPVDVLALSVPRSGNGATRVLQAPIAEGAEPASDRVSPAVSLTAIDYGPGGKLSLSGEAEPGAALNVYLDNALVGSANADEEGRWSVTPGGSVEPGLYTLRADQLADTGKVEARVEVPFLRADPLTELPDDRFVVVQPGNSLWRLARRSYGLGIQYTIIFQANAEQIRDPDLIYPGQIFMLPPTN